MTKIVLIRPGRTDFDVQGRIQGTLDVPLNEEGACEAAAMADALRPLSLEIVYCSPSEPSQETAGILAEALGVKCKTVAGLGNVDHGLWQGMLLNEVKRKHPKVFRQWQELADGVRPPEGETFGEARKRVADALRRILKKQKMRTIGLVVAEPLASLVRDQLHGPDPTPPAQNGKARDPWEILTSEPPVAAHSL